MKGGIFCPPGNTVAATQGESISSAGWFWHPSTPSTLLSAQQIAADHLDVLQPRYCTFILNTPPNREGLLDPEVVSVLGEVGVLWRPSPRPPLPAQPDVLRYPVTATAATATSGNPSWRSTGSATSAGTARPRRRCGSQIRACPRRSPSTWVTPTRASATSPTFRGRARYIRLEATSAAGGAGVIASEVDTGGLNHPPVQEPA